MKPQHLNTPWRETLNRDNILDEYPRPQLRREKWINLNGSWDYSIENDSIGRDVSTRSISWEGEILVPFAVETDLSGVSRPLKPGQSLWYRRRFSLPDSWADQRIILHFEAVDWYCECLINGKMAGSHKGGYIPFHFDITDLLVEGDNEIILAVEDSTDNGFQQRGKQVLKPRSIYYEATSGIWQSVWLEPVSPINHIESINITPDIDNKVLSLSINTRRKGQVNVILGDREKEISHQVSGETDRVIEIPIENMRLWSPEDPYLYPLTMELYDKEEIVDWAESYCGMRKISSAPGKNGHPTIYLNNKPLFLHGPLDQGYWPESGMTPPAEEAILFDLEKMREFGFNMIRKHIKVEPRRWYYHADRLGLLVIQDAVSGGRNWGDNFFADILQFSGFKMKDNNRSAYRRALRDDPRSKEDFETELFEMMDHLHNHPSIVTWVPFNESWGQYDSRRISEEIRKKDPSRLVDHASGWVDQGGGDFCSQHTYVIPLKKKKGDDKRIHFISEYGGYNLKVPGHMWNESKKFGYRSYKDAESLENAYEKLIDGQLIPLIRHGLSAAVYTQLSDVEIESNGFFTYDRKVQKIDTETIRSLNEKIYEEYAERFGK